MENIKDMMYKLINIGERLYNYAITLVFTAISIVWVLYTCIANFPIHSGILAMLVCCIGIILNVILLIGVCVSLYDDFYLKRRWVGHNGF